MVGAAATLLAKVAAGTVLFVLVLLAVQSPDARIAGMMLTFPALNGMSLMLAPVADKRAMGRAMLGSIALNGCNGLAFIALFWVAVRMGAAPREAAWPLAVTLFVPWLAACWVLGRVTPPTERGFVWGFVLLAPLVAAALWITCPGATGVALSHGELVSANALRILLFALAMALLLAVADALGDAHALVGRLGAFPLLPLFSLATIAEAEAAVGPGLGRLAVVAPAMLLGLLLAMAFVRLYAGWLMRLTHAGLSPARWTLAALAGLIAGWLACGAVIAGAMRLAAWIEGCR
jgi:hypothetical protein